MKTTTNCICTLTVFKRKSLLFWKKKQWVLSCSGWRAGNLTFYQPYTNTKSVHVLGWRPLWLSPFPPVVSLLSNLLQPHAKRLLLTATHVLTVGRMNARVEWQHRRQSWGATISQCWVFFFHLKMQRYSFAWQSSITLTQIHWQLRIFRCFWCTSQGCLENNNVWFEEASRHIASGCNK